MDLDVWLEWISTILIVDSKKRDEVPVPILESRTVITVQDCWWQCGHDSSEVVVPRRNRGFSMRVTAKELISRWEGSGSHQLVYYTAVIKRCWWAHCIRWRWVFYHCLCPLVTDICSSGARGGADLTDLHITFTLNQVMRSSRKKYRMHVSCCELLLSISNCSVVNKNCMKGLDRKCLCLHENRDRSVVRSPISACSCSRLSTSDLK